MFLNTMVRVGCIGLAVSVLASCGGGGTTVEPTGGSGSGSGSTGATTLTYTPGVYPNETSFKDFCANPRTGIDPYSSSQYPDKAGSATHEKMWLRSWSNKTYLWYREVDDINPEGYGVLEYFALLKTTQTTDSGALKDQYHFAENTADYLKQTQSGVVSGYGIRWKFIANSPPRRLVVAYVETGSPAEVSGIKRGDSLVAVDGIDFVNDSTQQGVDAINDAIYPDVVGRLHQFTFKNVEGVTQNHNLVSKNVATTPVQNVKVITHEGKKVGYMQFNTHIALAQGQLTQAINTFSQNGVSELVVDLRYNGGGLLALASQFGYMVAGPNNIQGRFFEKMQFNDKYPSNDPVTGARLEPVPFYNRVIDYDGGVLTSQSLPTLALNRVFVLTTGATCSASEAFINALRGVDVEVIQIGDKTCGKPYGFYPTDNCGTTYFTVQFKGINAKGFGDFADGFVPKIAPVFEADVKGCPLEDDLTKPLGDVNEGLLKAALYYTVNNSCPVTVVSQSFSAPVAQQHEDGMAIKTLDPRQGAFLLESKINKPIREQ